MGRSNTAILAIGLVSILAMSLLMKQFLTAAETAKRPAALSEVVRLFGDRLDGPPELVSKGPPNNRRAVVTVLPAFTVGERDLAFEIGEYVWRRMGDADKLVKVEVVCLPWTKSDPTTYDIPRPYMTSRPQPAPAANSVAPAQAAEKAAPAGG